MGADETRDPAIRIVDYDTTWPTGAQAELRRLQAVLGHIAIRLEHVGSTSVPGLAAKPVLDLQLSVAAIDPRAAYVEPLERMGYLFVADPASPDYHFFGKPPQRPRSHHLHVCESGSAHEHRHLAVRDFLRTHDGEATRYQTLKREVAARHPEDRLAYIDGKDAYLAGLHDRALAWARDRS